LQLVQQLQDINFLKLEKGIAQQSTHQEHNEEMETIPLANILFSTKVKSPSFIKEA
jgi:hypothetical protein